MSSSMIIVIVLFLVLMLLGFPVLYALGLPCLVWLAMNDRMPVTILSQNMMAYLNSFTLLSLPGFMLVGRLMNTCGVTDRLFNLSMALVGRFRGGMAYANCVASAMFASMSGSAIADAGGLGLVEMKMMKQAGYDPAYSAGVTAASSIIGPIIPPSAAMVLLGAISQISVASMFFGGIVPGILLCGSLCLQVFLIAHFTEKGRKMPCSPVPREQALRTIPSSMPALFTFVIILGTILTGVCTTTEAAVVAVWYSIFLGFCYKKVTLKGLQEYGGGLRAAVHHHDLGQHVLVDHHEGGASADSDGAYDLHRGELEYHGRHSHLYRDIPDYRLFHGHDGGGYSAGSHHHADHQGAGRRSGGNHHAALWNLPVCGVWRGKASGEGGHEGGGEIHSGDAFDYCADPAFPAAGAVYP